MRNRIVDISNHAARLSVKRQQLVVVQEESEHTVPMEDISVLLVSHPSVSYTQAVLNQLIANGGVFVTCDDKRLPCGLLLRIDGNTVQSERFHQQIQTSIPRRKRLWQQIVRSKIGMQARLLQERNASSAGLSQLISLVKSGDGTNVEARAARVYWKALFGDNFRRERHAEDQNAFLNFGYAILRAAVCRGIVASGLHPTFGLHHHNRYNSFCLADDLMEPFRPLIDRVVARMVDENISLPDLQTVKPVLLNTLTQTIQMRSEQRSVFDAIAHTCQSLVHCIQGKATQLNLPNGFCEMLDRQTSDTCQHHE